MFDEVEARRAVFDKNRPLDPAALQKLDALFEPWFIYSSNALEGNTLTYGDTVYLIREGRLPAGKLEEEYLEVKGQQDAYAYLQQAAAGQFQLSEKLIREFHTLLTRNLSDPGKYGPGQYKERDNQVLLPDGSAFPYVPALMTRGAMQDLVEWYLGPAQQLHPIERAAGLHYKFILIHPFLDGNGRTARLLANLALLQGGFVIAVFRQDQHDRRRVYLDALRAVDQSVPLAALAPVNPRINIYPLVSYLEQELLWSYDRALEVVEGRGAVTADDLVRRFEKLEERTLVARGIASDDIERAKLLSDRVRDLTVFLEERAVTLLEPVEKTWNHLVSPIGVLIHPVSFLSEAIGFQWARPRARITALGLRIEPLAGSVGSLTVEMKMQVDSSLSLEVPKNRWELVIHAEPHRMVVASLFGVERRYPTDEAWSTDRFDLPLDRALWRASEIDDFLTRQIDGFLVLFERRMSEINQPSS